MKMEHRIELYGAITVQFTSLTHFFVLILYLLLGLYKKKKIQKKKINQTHIYAKFFFFFCTDVYIIYKMKCFDRYLSWKILQDNTQMICIASKCLT